MADLLLLAGARIERYALLAGELVLIGPANELGVFLRVLRGALAGDRRRIVVLFKELDLFELCIEMDDFLHPQLRVFGSDGRRALLSEGSLDELHEDLRELFTGVVDGGCGGREGTEAGRGGAADRRLGKGTSRDGGEIELENRSGPDDGTSWIGTAGRKVGEGVEMQLWLG